MAQPTRIVSSSFDSPRALLRCQEGLLSLTVYAPNVLHVAYFPGDRAVDLPMCGIVATPDSRVPAEAGATGQGDSATFRLRTAGLEARVDLATAQVAICRPDGDVLLRSRGFRLEPAVVSDEETFHVHAEFDAPVGERYYALGQHQVGWMDHAGQEVRVWHDYQAAGGEIVGVPFMVTNRGYGFILDNPSRVVVWPGDGGVTRWQAEAGPALSFFVIVGNNADDLYGGYRTLTGPTPLPPKAALGYIQCKQRYASQDEVLGVAREYRRRGYPCDMLVVDWFHWKTLGDLDLDEKFWPDPPAMNRELTAMGYQVMISAWPRFMKESRHWDTLESRGWFMKQAGGETLYGTPEDQRGAVIDTTNPATGRWYWDTIRDSYAAKGFTSWWLDEDEPDVCPHPYYLHAGTGAAVHNLYPLTHTLAVSEGHGRDLPHRCLILSRSAYLGAQRTGSTFWSSDIYPEWDVFRRQIPAGLNFCATGFPYWSSDIGGWQALADRHDKSRPARAPLIEPDAQARKVVGDYDDYVELYVRWFQFGALCPTFRAHGTRDANEVWSYGAAAEKILVEYLRLRYRLMPYIYSLAFAAWRTGAPFMRAMFMDFGHDERTADLKDQYMFGPALLVAPVTEQGRTRRDVYLPAGCDWYDFWTNRRYAGGQTVQADAPIQTLPLFVRAGSIVPLGPAVDHTGQEQRDIEVRVYEGADGRFDWYDDDGQTRAYQAGRYELLTIRWDDRAKQASLEGDAPNLRTRLAKQWLTRIGRNWDL